MNNRKSKEREELLPQIKGNYQSSSVYLYGEKRLCRGGGVKYFDSYICMKKGEKTRCRKNRRGKNNDYR